MEPTAPASPHEQRSHQLIARFEAARADVLRLVELWGKWRHEHYTAEENTEMTAIYDRLLREMGALEPVTTRLTGKRTFQQFGQHRGIWEQALDRLLPGNLFPGKITTEYISRLGDLLTETLGRLEAGANPEPPVRPQILRIFVSHGGASEARSRLERFIRSIGAEPVIVEDHANLGASVQEKVDREASSCHCAIVLSTGDRGAVQDGKLFPRLNIVDEIARLREIVGKDRVILLLEDGVNLPSNQTEIVRARFSQDSMDEAFIQIGTDLRALGFLRAQGSG